MLCHWRVWCRGRSRIGPFPVEDRDGSLRAGGCSPLSLPTFFAAAAKKVGAAPHRGEPNRPLRMQGKANAVRKQPKPNQTNNKARKGQRLKKTTPKPSARQTKNHCAPATQLSTRSP